MVIVSLNSESRQESQAYYTKKNGEDRNKIFTNRKYLYLSGYRYKYNLQDFKSRVAKTMYQRMCGVC